jgi:uncharacterized protein (DUF302 family)
MYDYGRRLVLDLTFDRGVEVTINALRSERFEVIARVDVRDELRRTLNRDFRRYVLLIVSTPQSMFDVLKKDLAAGAVLPITIALYELADGEVAVVAAEPFEAVSNDRSWGETCPELAKLAAIETERLARALDELSHRTASARPDRDDEVNQKAIAAGA